MTSGSGAGGDAHCVIPCRHGSSVSSSGCGSIAAGSSRQAGHAPVLRMVLSCTRGLHWHTVRHASGARELCVSLQPTHPTSSLAKCTPSATLERSGRAAGPDRQSSSVSRFSGGATSAAERQAGSTCAREGCAPGGNVQGGEVLPDPPLAGKRKLPNCASAPAKGCRRASRPGAIPGWQSRCAASRPSCSCLCTGSACGCPWCPSPVQGL